MGYKINLIEEKFNDEKEIESYIMIFTTNEDKPSIKIEFERHIFNRYPDDVEEHIVFLNENKINSLSNDDRSLMYYLLDRWTINNLI